MRTPRHKFRILWSGSVGATPMDGWHAREFPTEPACWGEGVEGAHWFERVAKGKGCDADWGGNRPTPTVFGFKETMEGYCNDQAGLGWFDVGDVGAACDNANLNVLRIGGWNMCRNVEWMWCVILGKVVRPAWSGESRKGGDGQIVFTAAPALLDIGPQYANNVKWFDENDIYPLEVCLLNEMCANRGELFSTAVGEPFYCQLDYDGWSAASLALLRLG